LKDKPNIVIVGPGLGGCILANSLSECFNITMIDRVSNELPNIIDIGLGAKNEYEIGYGKGGTTKYWHNGLIKIPEHVFTLHWPYQRIKLEKYYDEAYKILCKYDQTSLNRDSEKIANSLITLGISPQLLGEPLYYPIKRVNIWNHIKNKKNIKYINGDIKRFNIAHGAEKKITDVEIENKNAIIKIYGDLFVFTAGGLNTPQLLNKLLQFKDKSLEHGKYLPGSTLEDHPMAYVAYFETEFPLYKFWNVRSESKAGNIRIPLVKNIDGIDAAFYIKPSYSIYNKNKILSSLSKIRNNPSNIKNYIDLCKNNDDFLEAVSLKFGINVPTEKYLLLMVAGQDASQGGFVNHDVNKIIKKWNISNEYLNSLDRAVESILNDIQIMTKKITKLDWKNNIKSSSHYSATAKIGTDIGLGACNDDCKVYGFENLYISDASTIPASGYSNTGLTIAALSLKLAEYAKNKYK
jgi:hypothetical protein